ncbi:MAG: bacteriocin [Dysgonamonadaceae bacterium]|jgi:bacteriocin-like protein|nr:bacteriocin [Dysgonamonadaceae bacterium]
METNFDIKETNFENLKMDVLNEKEMSEINGGGMHVEWVDGKLILVYD